jgi:hypothetical protein
MQGGRVGVGVNMRGGVVGVNMRGGVVDTQGGGDVSGG